MVSKTSGGLAITRALGDHAFKSFGVSGKPHIVRHVLIPSDKFLIIASDGVWDTVRDQEACDHCSDKLSTKQIAKNIVKMALDN